MTKEITIGNIDVSGSVTVYFENKLLLDKVRRDLNAGYDPCDEMVTVEQVVWYCRPRAARMVGINYDRAAAIWGIDRDAAKRRVYQYCYGG